tara:strand:- start:130 stop:351 length:222 start_codon:yes stop_codon:yes gene_type:complete
MKSNITNKQRKQLKKEDIYIKEYHDCKTQGDRNNKMYNIASDNGRCWWIHQYLKANTTFDNYSSHSGYGKNRR